MFPWPVESLILLSRILVFQEISNFFLLNENEVILNGFVGCTTQNTPLDFLGGVIGQSVNCGLPPSKLSDALLFIFITPTTCTQSQDAAHQAFATVGKGQSQHMVSLGCICMLEKHQKITKRTPKLSSHSFHVMCTRYRTTVSFEKVD